jgi:hypothetical protein
VCCAAQPVLSLLVRTCGAIVSMVHKVHCEKPCLLLISSRSSAANASLVAVHKSLARRASGAQHSVQRTGGIRRDLQAVFWLGVFSTSQAESQPAHLRLTPAVGQFLARNKT